MPSMQRLTLPLLATSCAWLTPDPTLPGVVEGTRTLTRVTCPEGTVLTGRAPPDGREQWCMEDGPTCRIQAPEDVRSMAAWGCPPHGPWVQWRADDGTIVVGTFDRGRPTGEELELTADGQVMSVRTWDPPGILSGHIRVDGSGHEVVVDPPERPSQ